MAEAATNPPPMRVLVTGAAGFIGSHLAERLLADGHSVWGLDNFDPYYDEAIKRRNLETALRSPRMHLVEGDVRDLVLLAGLFRAVPFDLVVHLAARPGVEPSVREPELCYDVNVMGTLRLLETMRRHHVSRMVFASSASVYRGAPGAPLPMVEGTADRSPDSPYAASKLAGEDLCATWHRRHGLSVCCLRLFSVYGPRQRPELRIARFVRLLRNRHPIPVDGGMESGRDYVHVDDVVEGLMLSAERLRASPTGENLFDILNIGHGRAVQLGELVALLSEATGRKAQLARRPARLQESIVTLADIHRTEVVLGFRPAVDLETGIGGYLDWLDGLEEICTTAEAVARA